MRPMLRFITLALLLTALTALFYLQSPAQAASLRVQTDSGVVTMDMEDYLPGAVAAEMPALFPTEALKAQAVAIRSYVLAGGPRHKEADICTSAACCLSWKDEDALRALWGADYGLYWDKICSACRETRGQYLSYGGQAALAVFHAGSAGQTESSGAIWSPLPYLVSVASPETAADMPGLESVLSFPADRFAEILALEEPAVTAVVTGESGRVDYIEAGGKRFSGEELRSLLGLRSTAFTIEQTDTEVIFRVRGSGHGVGLSQYGAKVYAQKGLAYHEILAHYYPGTELVIPNGD